MLCFRSSRFSIFSIFSFSLFAFRFLFLFFFFHVLTIPTEIDPSFVVLVNPSNPSGDCKSKGDEVPINVIIGITVGSVGFVVLVALFFGVVLPHTQLCHQVFSVIIKKI